MLLALAAAMLMQSNVPGNWQMGGGRAWMNPPAPTAANPASFEGQSPATAERTEPPPEAQAQAVSGRTWLLPPKLPPCLPNGYCFTRQDLRETRASLEAARKAREEILNKAKHGDVRAMWQTGFMLLNRLAGPKDEAGAMGWFYEAANRGHANSMYGLACGFEQGVGVTADPKLAAYWHERATKQGAPKTCNK
ncbi:hypothetical protein [Sphingomonas sp.]|uniref:tetratricopeptide repeat protein n=1 Tax=Sphingomonas sp. TaxID=28214 RepID=UPI0025E03E6F|nr:hypothetical protein [Sphingomonas sp.]